MKKIFLGALVLACTATMAQKSTTTKKVTAT
ncbi:unnamed protein product, partial [Rotaria sp. Silwood1]